MKPVRVLVVEDSATFVRGLEVVLGGEGRFVVAGVVNNNADAVALVQEVQPDVALVDLRIKAGPVGRAPDFRHGLDSIAALKAESPRLRVLAMSYSNDTRWPTEAVHAGASGFVSKDASAEEFVAALCTVADGGVVLTAEQLAQVAAMAASPSLTRREREVLHMVGNGKSNREIAEALDVAVGTVRSHVGNILAKLGVDNRKEAVAEARRRRLLSR